MFGIKAVAALQAAYLFCPYTQGVALGYYLPVLSDCGLGNFPYTKSLYLMG